MNTLDEANWNKTAQNVREKVQISNDKLHELVEWSNEYILKEVGPVEDGKIQNSTISMEEFIRKNLQATLVPDCQDVLWVSPLQRLVCLGSVLGALIAWVMFIIALYYFLADGYLLIESTQSLIPVHVDYQKAY